jgi:hypothetical protein
MDFQAPQYSIDTLVQWIRMGRLALPDFQRDFVWDPSNVVELLDSVSRQWPIGSLLFLSGPQQFGVRAIADGPSISGSDPLDVYVLDGQQRLTALYHAVCDVSEYVYFVDFKAILGEGVGQDYIGWEARDKFFRRYPDLRHRALDGVALIRDVWDLDSFYQWLDVVEIPDLRRQLVRARETSLSGLQSQVYKVMAIQLDKKIDLQALARIFETLNRTGLRLNAFDLIVAMLYPMGFNLRREWELVCSNSDFIAKFQSEPIEILRLVALRTRAIRGKSASRGVRQGDLLRLDRQYILDMWASSASFLERALALCVAEFGVFCADALPSWAMVHGVAAWLEVIERSPAGVRMEMTSSLRRWFWHRGFAQVYAQAANTQVVSDFDAIFESGGSVGMDSLLTVLNDLPSLLARKNGLATRTLCCLIAKDGGLDLVSGERLVNCTGFKALSIQEGGLLSSLASNDQLSSVVFVSETSARKLAKVGGRLSELVSDRQERERRLASQSFSGEVFARTGHDLRRALLRAVPEVQG